jgi:hypothetical protein
MNNSQIQQNYSILTQNRANIEKIVREFEILDSAQENGNIKATMNYYNYILLLFITILLIFLLLRFSVSKNQYGGANLTKISKIFGYHK